MSELINKVRPTDPLIEQLQDKERESKAEQQKTIHEKSDSEIIKHHGQNKLLTSVGERLRPDGYKHVGSLAVHVYSHKMLENSAAFLCQVSLPKGLNELAAQRAIRELIEHVMAFYGHEPPRKRGHGPKYGQSVKQLLNTEEL